MMVSPQVSFAAANLTIWQHHITFHDLTISTCGILPSSLTFAGRSTSLSFAFATKIGVIFFIRQLGKKVEAVFAPSFAFSPIASTLGKSTHSPGWLPEVRSVIPLRCSIGLPIMMVLLFGSHVCNSRFILRSIVISLSLIHI